MSASTRYELLKHAAILLVDDLEANIRLLGAILQQAGHSNLAATSDPRDALRLYGEFQPDLIVMDLKMPQLDGFELIRQLREHIPPGGHLPILVLTADGSSEARRRALASGASDFVLKPFDNTELLLRIRNLLDNRFLHTELHRQNGLLEELLQKRTRELDEARERAAEAETAKERLLREMLRCVTKDKLHLAEPDQIPNHGRLVLTYGVDGSTGYAELRARLREIAGNAGMDARQTDDLVLASGEALANAIKHAERGLCEVRATDDCLLIRVSDQGDGIRPEDLPASLLLPGFSSKVSLGMGYTMMLELTDRIWLATGPQGTIVQLEKGTRPAGLEPALASMLDRFSLTPDPPIATLELEA